MENHPIFFSLRDNKAGKFYFLRPVHNVFIKVPVMFRSVSTKKTLGETKYIHILFFGGKNSFLNDKESSNNRKKRG